MSVRAIRPHGVTTPKPQYEWQATERSTVEPSKMEHGLYGNTIGKFLLLRKYRVEPM
jgi:hypothetical protein